MRIAVRTKECKLYIHIACPASSRVWHPLSIEINVYGAIILDGGHNRGHELKEEHQCHIWLDVLALLLGFFDELPEPLCVLAGVNRQLLDVQVWVLFEGDCFVLVLGRDILENLVVRQRLAVLVAARQPHPRAVVIVVVGDGQNVFPAGLALKLVLVLEQPARGQSASPHPQQRQNEN